MQTCAHQSLSTSSENDWVSNRRFVHYRVTDVCVCVHIYIYISFLSPPLWLQILDKCEYSLQKLRVSMEHFSPCTIYERLKRLIQNFSISYETHPLQLRFWKYSRYKRWTKGVLCHHCMDASCWYSIHQNGLPIYRVSQNRIIRGQPTRNGLPLWPIQVEFSILDRNIFCFIEVVKVNTLKNGYSKTSR